MTNKQKQSQSSIMDNFQFTKRFQFRTSVPVDVCAERIGNLPFMEGKSKYTTEIDPISGNMTFDIWAGSRRNREARKARVIGNGRIIQQGKETLVEGEVKIGLNRMLGLGVMMMLSLFWVIGVATLPTFWFLYMLFVGGFPTIALVYLFYQNIKERNTLLTDIQMAVTPHLSDKRTSRLEDQQSSSQASYTIVDDEQEYRRRQ
jgi:hypothetical protein